MTIDDGGPAFPVISDVIGHNEGMSLRDWFAGQAIGSVMQVCANDTLEPGETITDLFARRAYRVADAMLAARAKGGAQ